MPLRVYIETYGCALNRSDEAIMVQVLRSRGHEVVKVLDEADVVIINTCTVRLDTEYNMLSRIKQLNSICAKNGKKLVVAGCMAKAQPYVVSLVAPRASLVSPQNSHKVHVAVESSERVILLEGERPRDIIGVCTGNSVVPIPIQEGCLSNCSFCIAKHARRQLISHSVEAVVSAVKSAVSSGAVEIELTGMDLGVYGVDLYRKRALPQLLERIVESVDGNYMIRVGMINPEHLKYMLDELINVVKTSGKIYKFFHVPLQSGSDKVLKLMGRRYTVDEYRQVVKEIKNKIPGVSIATDIIVGHPGEEEEDFEETLRIIKELEFERVHLAGYSVRPHTLAASMPQVNSSLKKARLKKALEAIVEVGTRVREKYLNKWVKGFITERTSTWVARLDNYIPVVIKRCEERLRYGTWVDIYVDEITFFDIRGVVTW